MIVKHNCNEITSCQTLETLTNMVDEVYSMINDLVGVVKSLNRFIDDKIDDDDLLDILEEAQISSYANFNKFALDSSSNISSLNRSVRTMIDVKVYDANGDVEKEVPGLISTFNKEISQIVYSGAAPSISEIEKMRTFLSKMIGALAYFLKFEFNLDKSIETSETDDMIVDAVISEYCDRIDESVLDWCNTIMEVLKVYRPRLEVFDEHPELEEQFDVIMGPYLTDGMSEDLTLDIVNDVIAGKISPQDVWGILNPDLVDETQI